MTREYFSWCAALGMQPAKMEPLDMFLVAGRIIHEVKDTDRLAAIKAMTPEQRTELRHKITGVVEMPRK
jgi:hypothetical protein